MIAQLSNEERQVLRSGDPLKDGGGCYARISMRGHPVPPKSYSYDTSCRSIHAGTLVSDAAWSSLTSFTTTATDHPA